MATREEEIRARIAAFKEENRARDPVRENQEIINRLEAFIGQKSSRPAGVGPIPEADVTMGQAFRGGVSEGLLAPLTILGREPRELPLDSTGEKVANVLGELVGFGVGFYGMSVGVGLGLKGVGMASGLRNASVVRGVTAKGAVTEAYPVYDFVRYVLAGTAQQVGTSEDAEDIPLNAAIGLGFGLTVDGFFLARALKARARDAGRIAGRVDTGSPVTDLAASGDQVAKEILVTPNGQSAEEIAATVRSLADESKSLEQVIADLTDLHKEIVVIPGIRDTDELVRYATRQLPDAQIHVRKTVGDNVHEVLIHNPMDESGRLTAEQIAQWEKTGVFEGMALSYRGRTVLATGEHAAPGRISVRTEDGRATFSIARTDVSNFIAPVVFNQARRFASMVRENIEATIRSATEIGFAIPVRGARGVEAIRRGVVDTSEYVRVGSYREWIDANRADIQSFNAASFDEAVAMFTETRGIKGLVEVEHGITQNVRIFDQTTVRYSSGPPVPNVDYDQAVLRTVKGSGDNAAVETLVDSFKPSWRNSIAGPLRRIGIPEKEINAFIDQYTSSEARRLQEAVMSEEFKTILRSSEARFYGGCL